jgi:3-oxoacyl-[acyl-carrier protein] reductase
MDFTGKTVLVTGATRGIGAAIAQAFQAAHANLILTGTNPEEIDRRNRENERNGVQNVRYCAVDLANPDSLDEFLAFIELQDRIDVCVNNAGINRINPIDAIRTEDLDAILAVNLRAPILVCRSVSRLMKRTHYGRIVNIASIWSVISKPGRAAYTATKFGIAGMTKTLAAELGASGILVNAVSPGFIETEMTATTLSADERRALAAQVPLNRFGRPEEIARVVLFLSSDLNTYLTGQNIVVDGGFVSV